ncbi:hypothetical protein [Leifsonia poae]|uniref:hypothetical protein n=1 Tax=Leifsonia poae TaxID=110933 RepID=UPI001CC1617C|nr:hypothetical protein [Leifsonia poae]
MTIRQFFDALASVIELRAAEASKGVLLVEAIAADEFETQLRTLTANADERAALRRMAIQLAQLGIREEQIEPMARDWYTQPARREYELEALRHTINTRIDVMQGKGTTA